MFEVYRSMHTLTADNTLVIGQQSVYRRRGVFSPLLYFVAEIEKKAVLTLLMLHLRNIKLRVMGAHRFRQ